MPLYTFYPCKADATADTFVCFDLSDDAAAHVHALHVLDQHATSTQVVVWCGERKVLTRSAVHSDLMAVLCRERPEAGD